MSSQRLIVRPSVRVAAKVPASDPQEMIFQFGHALRRWWILGLFAGLLTALGAATVTYLTYKPEYKASIWLRIYATAPFIVFQDRDDSVNFVENQIQLIRSPLVLNALLKDSQIADMQELANARDKVEELASRLTVQALSRSEYFAVAFRSLDPNMAHHVVELVVNAYVSLQNSDEARENEEVVLLLDGEKALREQKVAELRSELARLVEETSASEEPVSPFADEQLASLADLRKRLVTVDVDAAVLAIEIQAAQKSLENPEFSPPIDVIDQSVDEYEQVVSIERDIRALEDKLRVRAGIGDHHPYRERLYSELEARKKNLASLKEKLSARQLKATRASWEIEREAKLKQMQERMVTCNATKQAITSNIEVVTQSIKKRSGDSLQVEFLRAELSQATEVHNLISRRLLALRTEQRAPARVQVLEEGRSSASPVELVPYRKMAMFSVVAFSVPSLLLFGFELLICRVVSAHQIERGGALPVVGEIAHLPRAHLILNRRKWNLEDQLYRESVDHLRTCLVCQKSSNGTQVIAVTSAMSREGKTSLSLHFARSLSAATGDPVLIVDGDMRCPNVHRLCNCDLAPGLTDVLEGRVKWEDACRLNNAGHPSLLVAGKLHVNPHRLFGKNSFEELIANLRPHFPHIIIDTPPILAASEALVMARAADAFVLCAMRDRSRMSQICFAHERLRLTGARSLGVVLMGVPFRSYLSRYGQYAYSETSCERGGQ